MDGLHYALIAIVVLLAVYFGGSWSIKDQFTANRSAKYWARRRMYETQDARIAQRMRSYSNWEGGGLRGGHAYSAAGVGRQSRAHAPHTLSSEGDSLPVLSMTTFR